MKINADKKVGVARCIGANGPLDGLLSTRFILAFIACGLVLVSRGLVFGMVTANYGNNDDPDALGKRPQDELHVVDVFEEIIFDNPQPDSVDTDEIYNSRRHKILNFLAKYNLQDVDALSHYIGFCDRFEECLESVDNLLFTINIGNCIANEDCLRTRPKGLLDPTSVVHYLLLMDLDLEIIHRSLLKFLLND